MCPLKDLYSGKSERTRTYVRTKDMYGELKTHSKEKIPLFTTLRKYRLRSIKFRLVVITRMGSLILFYLTKLYLFTVDHLYSHDFIG